MFSNSINTKKTHQHISAHVLVFLTDSVNAREIYYINMDVEITSLKNRTPLKIALPKYKVGLPKR